VLPNQDLFLECHMSWSFLCSILDDNDLTCLRWEVVVRWQWFDMFEMRGGCSFCWCWWNCWSITTLFKGSFHNIERGRRVRDRMVFGFTTTYRYTISAYHHWCEFEFWSGRGVQHYVIKFVSDLRQIDAFLWVLRFPPPIKLTVTI